MSQENHNSSLPLPGGLAAEVPLFRLLSFVSMFQLSLRRLVYSRFLWANLILGALPVVITILWACFADIGMEAAEGVEGSKAIVAKANDVFQVMLRTLYLQFIVFFVAIVFGFSIMRQESDDQTLHYLFLQPVERWIIVMGKLAASLVLGMLVCMASYWLTYLIMNLKLFGVRTVVGQLFGEGYVVFMLKECGVIALALVAYTSIAMIFGSLFKSVAFAIILMAWEAGLPYLPGTMKLWTIMHYLQSLLPQPVVGDHKLFEIWSEPASVLMSLSVIFCMSAFFVCACIGLNQYRECKYGGEST